MLKGFPRRSYYGRTTEKPIRVEGITPPSKTIKKAAPKPAPKKQIDSFEAEYQKFIADLKAKKETEAAKKIEEAKVETPVLTEEPKEEAEVIPETVTTVAEEAPILNEETQPKKTKKKKAETVDETTIDGLD